MRSLTVLFLPFCLAWAPISTAAPSESGAYRIVLGRHAVSAGEHIDLKLVPPVPPGTRLFWEATSGPRLGTSFFTGGAYRAPFVIPPGTPPVTVYAYVNPGPGDYPYPADATAEIELLPGSVPGTEDCLAPGQSFSTVTGTIVPRVIYGLAAPELIHHVDPEYPRSAFARGIEDTLLVTAVVCVSGRVLDAYVDPSYTWDWRLIERDPKLVEAALAAVRQYIFKPAIDATGRPIAGWTDVPVVFQR